MIHPEYFITLLMFAVIFGFFIVLTGIAELLERILMPPESKRPQNRRIPPG
jgi:hypothetical protein